MFEVIVILVTVDGKIIGLQNRLWKNNIYIIKHGEDKSKPLPHKCPSFIALQLISEETPSQWNAMYTGLWPEISRASSG